jgi:hypothetical protein
MYKLIYDDMTGKVATIIRLSDNASIPIHEGNKGYRDFLAWNSKQTKPLDLKSTVEVVKPVVRNLVKELDDLKAQVTLNTTKLATIK